MVSIKNNNKKIGAKERHKKKTNLIVSIMFLVEMQINTKNSKKKLFVNRQEATTTATAAAAASASGS